MSDKVLWQFNEMYNDLQDEEIIELIKSGDKNALEYIINKYMEVVNIKVNNCDKNIE